jgi:hypothetical protein
MNRDVVDDKAFVGHVENENPDDDPLAFRDPYTGVANHLCVIFSHRSG